MIPKRWIFYTLFFFSTCVTSGERHGRYTDPSMVVPSGELPWIVLQSNYYGRWCTGTLVTNKHVITSAHCLNDKESWNLKVEFINAKNSPTINVIRFIKHPDYVGRTETDIAIMELSEPVDIQPMPNIDFFKYICYELIHRIKNPVAAGFQGTTTLKKVNLSWLMIEECQRVHKYALYYSGYSDNGDSGGPLFYESNNKSYIIGVHRGSFDYKGSIAYYASFSRNVDFITGYLNLSSAYGDENFL